MFRLAVCPMVAPGLVGLVVLVLATAACGDDGGVGGQGGGGEDPQGGGGNGEGANGGAGGAGGAGGQDLGGGGTGGGAEYPPVPCGEDLTCDAGDVCIVEPIEPECSVLEKGDSCPEGTEQTFCGGAGQPCCCAPTPPPAYRCTGATDCAGELPTCACIEPCEDVGDECTALAVDPYTFRCEPPAKP